MLQHIALYPKIQKGGCIAPPLRTISGRRSRPLQPLGNCHNNRANATSLTCNDVLEPLINDEAVDRALTSGTPVGNAGVVCQKLVEAHIGIDIKKQLVRNNVECFSRMSR